MSLRNVATNLTQYYCIAQRGQILSIYGDLDLVSEQQSVFFFSLSDLTISDHDST